MTTKTAAAPEAKTVNFNQRWFEANGKKYFVSDRISIRRWKEYEKLQPRLTYGVEFDQMNKAHAKAFAALNDRKFADAAVIIHNLMTGIKDVTDDKRIHPGLLMAALVINREGEDVTDYDYQLQVEKIQDWEKEGLNILDFFRFALQSITGFRETYTLFIREQAEQIAKEIKEDAEPPLP